MALEDFLEIKNQNPNIDIKSLTNIVGQKYGINVDLELLKGKPLDLIIQELISKKPEAGLFSPITRGLEKSLINIYGTVSAIPEFLGLPVSGRKTAKTAIQRMEQYAPKRGPISKTVEEAIGMLGPSIFIPGTIGLGAKSISPAIGFETAATWLGPAPFAAEEYLNTKEQVKKQIEETGKKAGYIPTLAGLVNGIIEYFGEAIGTKYLGKLFGLDEGFLASRALRAKNLLKSIGVETGTEFGQSFSEQLAQDIATKIGQGKNVDLPSAAKDALSQALEVIPPTVLMTLMTGGLGMIPPEYKMIDQSKPQEPFKQPALEKGSLSYIPRLETGFEPSALPPSQNEFLKYTYPYFGEAPQGAIIDLFPKPPTEGGAGTTITPQEAIYSYYAEHKPQTYVSEDLTKAQMPIVRTGETPSTEILSKEIYSPEATIIGTESSKLVKYKRAILNPEENPNEYTEAVKFFKAYGMSPKDIQNMDISTIRKYIKDNSLLSTSPETIFSFIDFLKGAENIETKDPKLLSQLVEQRFGTVFNKFPEFRSAVELGRQGELTYEQLINRLHSSVGITKAEFKKENIQEIIPEKQKRILRKTIRRYYNNKETIPSTILNTLKFYYTEDDLYKNIPKSKREDAKQYITSQVINQSQAWTEPPKEPVRKIFFPKIEVAPSKQEKIKVDPSTIASPETMSDVFKTIIERQSGEKIEEIPKPDVIKPAPEEENIIEPPAELTNPLQRRGWKILKIVEDRDRGFLPLELDKLSDKALDILLRDKNIKRGDVDILGTGDFIFKKTTEPIQTDIINELGELSYFKPKKNKLSLGALQSWIYNSDALLSDKLASIYERFYDEVAKVDEVKKEVSTNLLYGSSSVSQKVDNVELYSNIVSRLAYSRATRVMEDLYRTIFIPEKAREILVTKASKKSIANIKFKLNNLLRKKNKTKEDEILIGKLQAKLEAIDKTLQSENIQTPGYEVSVFKTEKPSQLSKEVYEEILNNLKQVKTSQSYPFVTKSGVPVTPIIRITHATGFADIYAFYNVFAHQTAALANALNSVKEKAPQMEEIVKDITFSFRDILDSYANAVVDITNLRTAFPFVLSSIDATRRNPKIGFSTVFERDGKIAFSVVDNGDYLIIQNADTGNFHFIKSKSGKFKLIGKTLLLNNIVEDIYSSVPFTETKGISKEDIFEQYLNEDPKIRNSIPFNKYYTDKLAEIRKQENNIKLYDALVYFTKTSRNAELKQALGEVKYNDLMSFLWDAAKKDISLNTIKNELSNILENKLKTITEQDATPEEILKSYKLSLNYLPFLDNSFGNVFDIVEENMPYLSDVSTSRLMPSEIIYKLAKSLRTFRPVLENYAKVKAIPAFNDVVIATYNKTLNNIKYLEDKINNLKKRKERRAGKKVTFKLTQEEENRIQEQINNVLDSEYNRLKNISKYMLRKEGFKYKEVTKDNVKDWLYKNYKAKVIADKQIRKKSPETNLTALHLQLKTLRESKIELEKIINKYNIDISKRPKGIVDALNMLTTAVKDNNSHTRKILNQILDILKKPDLDLDSALDVTQTEKEKKDLAKTEQSKQVKPSAVVKPKRKISKKESTPTKKEKYDLDLNDIQTEKETKKTQKQKADTKKEIKATTKKETKAAKQKKTKVTKKETVKKETTKQSNVEIRPSEEDYDLDLGFSLSDLYNETIWARGPIRNPSSKLHLAKTEIEKTLQDYADTILGDIGIKIEIVSPDRIYTKLLQTHSIDEIKQALYRHNFTDEDINTYGIPTLLKKTFLGATIKGENLSALIYLNEHLNRQDAIKAGIHELTEALMLHNRLDPRDINILKRKYGNVWSEKLADGVADYLFSKDFVKKEDKSIIQRIGSFISEIIEKFRNLLHGDGFYSVNDLVKSISSGEYSYKQPIIDNVIEELKFALDTSSFLDTSGISKFDLNTIGNMIKTGLSYTKVQLKDFYENYIMNQQWTDKPFRKTIFNIVTSARENTSKFIYEHSKELHDLLREIKKENKVMYKRLNKAIVDSDIQNEFKPEEILRKKYKLDNRSIDAYKKVKQVFDKMIDDILTGYQESIGFAFAAQTMDMPVKETLKEIFTDKDSIKKYFMYVDKTEEELKNYFPNLGLPQISVLYSTLQDMKKDIQEIERQKKVYQEGFYFPRIRPSGKFSVSVFLPDKTTGLRKITRFNTDPSLFLGKEAAQVELLIKKSTNNIKAKNIFTITKNTSIQAIKKAIDNPDYDTLVFKTEKQFKMMEKDLQATNKKVIVVSENLKMPASFYENMNNSTIMNMLDHLLAQAIEREKLYGNAAEYAQKLSRVIRNNIQDLLKERSSARARFIRRKQYEGASFDLDLIGEISPEEQVVTGYKEDILEALSSYVGTMGEHLSRIRAHNLINYETSFDEYKTLLSNNPQEYKWFENYVKGVMSASSPLSNLTQRVKAISSIFYLGLRASSALIQLTQMFTTAVPELAPFINAKKMNLIRYIEQSTPLSKLGEHLERQTNSIKYNTKAFKDVVNSLYNPNVLTKDEKRALEEAIKSGITVSQFVNDVLAQQHRLFGKFTPLGNFMMKPFQIAEQKTREAGFLAAYRLAREKGLSFEQAVSFGNRFVKNAFHVYDKSNRPIIALRDDGLGSLVNVLTTLRGYELNYMGWLYKSMKKTYGKRNIDKAIASFIYTALLGGLFSIPGLDQLLNWFGNATGIPLKKKIINAFPKGAIRETATYGVLAPLFNIDISGSMKLGILPEELSMEGIADSIFGVWRGNYNKASKFMSALEAREFDLAAKAISPLFLESLIKGYEFMKGEPYRMFSGKLITDLYGRPVKLDETESVLQMLGFRPVTLSKTWVNRQAVDTIKNYWKKKRIRINLKLKNVKTWNDLRKIIPYINTYNRQVLKYGGAIPVIDSTYIRQILSRAWSTKPEKLAPFVK